MRSTNDKKVRFLPESLALLEKCIRRLASDGGVFEGDLIGLWGALLKDEPERFVSLFCSTLLGF